MNRIKNEIYLCCFCDTLIKSSQNDLCIIDVQINENNLKNKLLNQIFCCHMECFRDQLHEEVRSNFVLEGLIQSNVN